MADNIRGLTVEINGDTTKLGKALKTIDSQGKTLSKQLKEVDKLLKLDPSNTEAVAAKQEILAESVANTKQRVDILRQAYEQASKKLANGEIGAEQHRALQIELMKSEQRLQELEDASRGAADAGDKLEKQMAETAQETTEAAKATEEASKATSAFADVLKANLLSSAIKKGIDMLCSGLKAVKTSTKDYTASATDIYNNSAKVGVSAETLQTWMYAAEQCGVSSETLLSAMVKQQTYFANASEGNEKAIASYERLGISVKSISSGDAFQKTIYALSQIADATERDALANSIFGESYAALTPLLAEGQNGINALRNEAVEIGLVMANDDVAAAKAYGDSLTKTEGITTGLRNQLMSGLLPALSRVEEAMQEALADEDTQKLATELGEQIGTVAKKWIPSIIRQAPKLINGIGYIVDHLDTIYGITKLIASISAAAFAVKKVKEMISGVKKLADTYKALKASEEAAAAAANATGWGLAITAIGLVISSVVELISAEAELKAQQEELLREGQRACDNAIEIGKAYQQQRNDVVVAADTEVSCIRDLWKELQSLVDQNGNVKDGYEDRAETIKTLLSEATGIELELIDGEITGYKNLWKSIDDVIQLKKANYMLERGRTDYEAAYDTLNGSEMGSQAYYERKNYEYESTKRLFRERSYISSQINPSIAKAYSEGEISLSAYRSSLLENMKRIAAIDAQISAILGTDIMPHDKTGEALKLQRDAALYAYEEAKTTVAAYETLQDSVLSEDPEQVAVAVAAFTDGMLRASQASYDTLKIQAEDYKTAYEDIKKQSETVNSSVTPEQLNEKLNKRISAQIEVYKKMLKNSDKYTEEELAAQRQTVADALAETGKYTSDEMESILDGIAEGTVAIGSDYVKGFIKGIDDNLYLVAGAGRRMGATVLESSKSALDIHSPSRRAEKEVGANYDMGVARGVLKNADKVAASGKRLAMLLHDSVDPVLPAMQTSAPVMDNHQVELLLVSILDTVKKLDLDLTIDGDKLVEKTSARTDQVLGQRAEAWKRSSLQ